MEEDDEFGDLYADVLQPLATQQQLIDSPVAASTSPTRNFDLNTSRDDEEILYETAEESKSKSKSKSNFDSAPGMKLSAPIEEKTVIEPSARPETRAFDLNLDSREDGDDLGFESRPSANNEKLPEKASRESNFMDEADDLDIVVEERDDKDDDDWVDKGDSFVDQKENPGSNFDDDWESDDSEDDLQIVLNDTHHGPLGMEEEDGDPLVIVADDGGHYQQQMMMDEQEWEGEEGAPADGGERKELGEGGSRTSGAGNSANIPGQQKSGFMYHQTFHSQFKYVRPGAAPIPGSGNVPSGQVRPPLGMGPTLAGRGRGDWRPTGQMQNGFRPAWGMNTGGRGYGSGLDFTLPSHKTIFEVDIDSFEEKPWKLTGIDMSDFFNFGLNEDSWKDYCKQLEQLRLETTMQRKISVHESGRAEQDDYSDLPPELAAAVSNQVVPSENTNPEKLESGPPDLTRAYAHGRPNLPIGRPIPAETCFVDRIPSIDTRRPRLHDSDAIIEIVCQGSSSDDEMAEPQDNDPTAGEEIERDTHHPDGDIGVHHEERSREGRGRLRSPKMDANNNNNNDNNDINNNNINNSNNNNKREDVLMDDRNEESFDSRGVQESPESSSRAVRSDAEQDVAVRNNVNDESIVDDKSFNEEAVDIISRDEISQENADVEDSKATRSSESSKARHHKSRDSVEDEILQEKNHPKYLKEDHTYRKGRHAKDEISRHSTVVKAGREDSSYYSRRGGWNTNTNSSLRRHVRSESEENWHRKDEDFHGRRMRIEGREHGGEMGSRNKGNKVREIETDDIHSWKGASYGQEMGPRNRNQKVNDLHGKRRKEDAYYMSRDRAEKEDIPQNDRENSSTRRNRERDDGSDHRKSVDPARLKDGDVHYMRQKEEGLFQRPRDRDEWHRLKQSQAASEDKTWISHSRGKEDYRGREYNKRRDRVENENNSHHKVESDDVYSRGARLGNDEKRPRYERPNIRDDENLAAYASERKVKDRKSKESEIGDHSFLTHSRRNPDEHGISKTVVLRAKTDQGNVKKDLHLHRQSSKKHRGDASASSDEEEQTDSRKGRSKLERWTSHKDREFNIASIPSSSLKNKDLDVRKNVLPEELPKKVEEISHASVDEKESGATDMNQAKVVLEDKHLDTVEKLKKRRERFKLPMPSEKEATGIKKIDSEPLLHSAAQTETRTDSEIKSERPPRKRRWTGN